MKKRILAVVLVLIAVINILPVSVSAASNDYTTWKQFDPEWGNVVLWPNAQYPTLAGGGCWITSVAILLRHYNIVTDSDVNSFNPLVCARQLMRYGIINDYGDWQNLGSLSNAYPGFSYVDTVEYSEKNLINLYNQGYACIVHETKGHYVAVRSVSGNSITVMDPGSSYTTSLTDSDQIQYFKTSGGGDTTNHVHSYWWAYEGAHPHRAYMMCSCGDFYYTGETFTIDGCELCRPGKPMFIGLKSLYDENETIEFTWNPTENTTHYNFFLYKENESGDYENIKTIFYAESGMKLSLSRGDYRALLVSTDSNHWTEDRSTWAFTNGDYSNFSVRGQGQTEQVEVTYNGNTYIYDSSLFTWYRADEICREKGGHLVVIDDEAENNFIWSIIDHRVTWIGASDSEIEGVWKWVTGDVCSYTNWGPGEPNNATWTEENSENYACIYEDGDGKWLDSAGTKTFGFVCEIEAHTHDLIRITPIDPTCREDGNIEYWQCKECGKLFSDSDATNEIALSSILIPALGHIFVNGICARCGEADPDNPPQNESDKVDVHFVKQNVYFQGQYSDVDANQWFTNNVASAFELGLMKGNSDGTFNPYGDVTLAEAITIASRIHSIFTTGEEHFVQGSPWYQTYLDYALENGIITKAYYNADVTHKATRAQFAEIFANSLPVKALAEMNHVNDNAIPDVKMNDSYAQFVYKLYRAGILTGGDVNGTFSPQTYITRAEAATIVSRMAESNNRVSFSLG